MKIIIGSDHAGLDLKGSITQFLQAANYDIEDVGPHNFVQDDDYPVYIDEVAKKIAADPENLRGIVIGSSGQGEAISANRFAGVRAALFYGGSEEIIRLSRQHNDANVLSLGAKFLSEEEAREAVSIWLNTEFSKEERHVRRIKQIDELAKK